jgi:hypothetical protein
MGVIWLFMKKQRLEPWLRDDVGSRGGSGPYLGPALLPSFPDHLYIAGKSQSTQGKNMIVFIPLLKEKDENQSFHLQLVICPGAPGMARTRSPKG